jgi:hypothetical protein|tara:strand:- start:842 stop:1084 length:243 start_codon:yes stop_codon:yes gene_type:complete
MSKKLTSEELKNLQDAVNSLNQIQLQVGGLELQKHELQHAAAEAKVALEKVQKELEDEYGQVSVDIQTGDIKESELSKED